MPTLTQSRGGAAEAAFLASTQVRPKRLVSDHTSEAGLSSWGVEVWGRCVGERVPGVAWKQSLKWLQNSAHADVFRLRKSSAGSEGKTRKETSVGVKLGSSQMRKCGMCTRARAHTRSSRSLIYCDKMNSPQVAHPAANFSSYLLGE